MTDDANNWDVWNSLLETNGMPPRESGIGTGYWRLPFGSSGTAVPVATWNDSGMWLALIGDKQIDQDEPEWMSFMAQKWPRLMAVDQDDYDTAVATSFWPDGTPTTKNERAEIGGNNPPVDAVEAMLAAAAETIAAAEKLIKAGAAKTATEVTVASNLASKLTGDFSDIEEKFKAEKKPWLEGAKAVDEKFAIKKDMQAKAKTLKDTVINPWQIAEDNRIKAEAAAEAKRVAEETAALMGSGEAVVIPAVVPTRKVATGSAGNKVSLQKVRYAIIESPLKFAEYLIGIENPDLKELLQTLGNRLCRNASVGQSPAAGVVVGERLSSR